MRPELVVDLTSVSVTGSGGVGRVATGMVEGLAAIGAHPRCLVSQGTRAAWAAALPDTDFAEVVVRMTAGSRWQTALRSLLPASLKTSRIVGAVRRVRSRAVRAAAGENVVWYPFHRSVATASTSVVTVHDLRVFEPDFSSPMDQRIIEQNIRHAKALVCSWPHPYESLITRFPDARDKTFQIPLPVLNTGTPRPERRAPTDELTLFYPAYVTEHKDHATLIHALALLPNARLICTGVETEYVRSMRALADELRVADRVEWRGYVDQAQLDAAYDEADVLVMPSLWEAASGPVLEAVVRHLPFVASDIPPLQAQIRHLGLPLEDWTFVARDPSSLAEAVERTVASYDERVHALAGPGAAVAGRTWETTAAEYASVFAWAAGTGTRPGKLQTVTEREQP